MDSLDDLCLELILSKACAPDDIATANALSCVSHRFNDAVTAVHPITSVRLDMEKLDSVGVLHWAWNHGSEVRELYYREAAI